MNDIFDDCSVPAKVFIAVTSDFRYVQKGYLSILEPLGEELVERTFAFKNTKNGTNIREVIRRDTNGNIVTRDIYYASMGGYVVIYEKTKGTRLSYYAPSNECFGIWQTTKSSPGITKNYIGLQEVLANSKFKYSGYSNHCDVIGYLIKWKNDSKIEIFGKLGITPDKSIVKLCKKDRQFCKFLRDNATAAQMFGPEATIYAYRNNMNICKARTYLNEKHTSEHFVRWYAKDLVGKKLNPIKIKEYVEKNKAYADYGDYIKAIVFLGLDLNDTKNIFPKDFKRMHDERIAEYESKKAKLDKEKKKKLQAEFKRASEKAKQTEICKNGLVVYIPTSIDELVKEGKAMNNCVGSCGYDKKVADGVSIIAFIRREEEKDKSFVTAEYRIDMKRLNQCYAARNSKPDDVTIEVAKEWEELCKKVLYEKHIATK